jgi:hypothetical protein
MIPVPSGTRVLLAAGVADRREGFAGLKGLLRPTIVEAIRDPFTPTQLGDAVLATQAGQHNPDLLFGGILLASPTADVPHCLLCPGFQGV